MKLHLSFDSETIFTPAEGSRSNVKKVLIVITDGASHDRDQLRSAADLAEGKNIVRFAIGVSSLVPLSKFEQLINSVAQHNTSTHLF